MRFITAFAILLLPVTASAADRHPVPPAKDTSAPGSNVCENPDSRHAARHVKPEAKSLGKLPPGNLLLAVQRNVGGCVQLALIRQGIGAVKPEAVSKTRRAER